ncbi:MAG TPA: ATP-binding protein [Candidatus Polarisedimenticolaceae bacterium]|nr:ATP-binding protein [Candidatus Polarisedimenticolaceae bacterium]
MSSRRGVLAALAGVAALASILLGFGVLQLVDLASSGGISTLEIFVFAVLLGATVLVLPAAVGWFAFRSLDRQLEGLTAAVDATLASPGPRSFVAPGGAAGELASALTRLVGEMVQRIDEGRREGRLLASIIGAMKEGMVVIGPDRKIRIANDAFRLLFRTPFDPVGRLLVEVVRDPSVFRELETALPDSGEIRETLLHLPGSGQTFELRVSPLAGRSGDEAAGALILFFDVTRLEALERVRRDFVADVSHELRTPLTSIKAFVENLIEERLADREEGMRFLEIVRKHADRMGALIDDLTDLSLIETGAVTLDLQPVDVAQVVREVAGQLAFRADAAGVALRLDVPVPFPIEADRRRLEQVLLNLIDNAIKFNRRGGYVRVTGAVADGRPRIAIEDSGVGIAGDALEQVFHRFFRVDTARSRELGGTGLGLAIVKHLMRLHDGRVAVTSELGRGSTFMLEFPPPSNGRPDGQEGSVRGMGTTFLGR